MADELSAGDAAALVDYLRERDATCPLCKYNVRGLTTPRCPECGQTLRLSVSLAEPYQQAWIATVVAVLPPAGIATVIAIDFLITAGRHRKDGVFDLSQVPRLTLLHIFACIPLSFAAVVARRRFLRLSRRTQLAFAAAGWTAVCTSLGCMMVEMY